jgi:hypothetical protein
MISGRLLSDRITIFKASGEKFENVSASVQKKIFINEVELPIEDGDTIEQTLPSGVVKKFLVTDVNVASGMNGPDHVEISYEKIR